MSIIKNLPDNVKYLINTFAAIKMSPEFLDQIENHYFKQVDKELDQLDLKFRQEYSFSLHSNFSNYLSLTFNEDEISYFINLTFKCRCCDRHSEGMMPRKYKKDSYFEYAKPGKKCRCCCRHIRRQMQYTQLQHNDLNE